MNNNLASSIRDRALELGYEECGIISLEEMRDYAQKLEWRMERFPESRGMYSPYAAFAAPQEQFPWAKAVVVCAFWYGRYRVPPHLAGLVGKSFLFDSRRDPESAGHRAGAGMDGHLSGLGLQNAREPDYGITALRWAAARAGLGIIRKNNFFYTKRGSWVRLEAWLIDKELELKHTPEVRKCDDRCFSCKRSCPSGALAESYSTNGAACVSFLTTKRGCTAGMPLAEKTGGWIFGCDACQDVCPNNKRSWKEEEDFPALAELAAELAPEKIMRMSYAELGKMLPPKFWYIQENEVWKWKTNALNALANTNPASPEFAGLLELARQDEHEQVRAMAEFVLAKQPG